MIRSGETIDLGGALGRKVVDKHSTGGVGDKTSLAVGPIVAACGVPFGKMSGRGLGHTGGTLDKLESIPGFRVELDDGRVRRAGARRRAWRSSARPATSSRPTSMLYALRDVTATVDQLSLIAASIMSKKLAAGAQAIVLDVKVGDGAFMKTLEDARHLAEAMLALGEQAGREVVCLLTDMDQPLGAAVGNALEVIEARATVRGEGPPDFTELVLDACARLLALSDLGDRTSARAARWPSARSSDGSAEAMWCRWIEAQGGTADESALERAPVVREVTAPRAGTVVRLGAIAVGNAALHLGAGRRTKADDDRPRGRRRLPRASAATRSRRARCSPRCTPATSAAADGRGRRGAGRVRARRRAAVERDRPGARSRSSTSRRGAAARARAVPELPEVETVRRASRRVLEGRAARAGRDRRRAAHAAARPGERRAAS